MELVSIPTKFKTPFKYGTVGYSTSGARDIKGMMNYIAESGGGGQLTKGTPDASGKMDMLFYGFDISTLPADIKITKVYFKTKLDADTYMSWFGLSISSGNTVLHSQDISIPSNAATHIIELPNASKMTPNDLQDLGLSFGYCPRSGFSATTWIYGMELHVEYELIPKYVYETPATNYVTPFKQLPTRIYTDAEAKPRSHIGLAFRLTTSENLEEGGVVFYDNETNNVTRHDGYFCGFDLSGIPKYSPIYEAKIRFMYSWEDSRVKNRTIEVYSSDALITTYSGDYATDDGRIYEVSIPKPKIELLQDIRLVITGTSSQLNCSESYKAVDLYVVYGDPMYDWVAGYPTNWIPDPNNPYGGITNFVNMCDEPDTLDTYSLYNNNSNQYSPDPYKATLINFAYPTLSSDVRIKKVRFRTSFSGSDDTKKAYDYYKFNVYLDNIKLCESQTFSMNSVPLENYLTPNYITITSDELNLKYSDISRLKVEIAQDQSFGSSNKVRFYGAALDLLALTDNDRPEWYPIIDTIVKAGNLTLDFTAAKPSNDVIVNEVPDTEGYIGNLYNDDLNDYAEFNYTPVPDENGVMPEDKPEFETIDLGVIRIDSPELTSLGVPGDAVITNIKLTKESLKHCTLANPSAELALYINDNKYDVKGFNISTSFTKTTYDTGKISIPKLEIRNDKAYFMLKWNSLNTPFTFQVKYLLWDITYELGGKTFTLQFAQENIDRMILGQAEVRAVYAGNLKIYG